MTIKPSWWDKDFSADFKSIITWMKTFIKKYSSKTSFKQFETHKDWEKARIAESQIEWAKLDAIQKEFERTGVKQSDAGFYRSAPNTIKWEDVYAETQRLAEKQRKEWGKLHWDDNGDR